MNSNFRYSFVILPTGSERAEYTYECETLAQHNSIKEELLDRMAAGSIKGFSVYKLSGRYVGSIEMRRQREDLAFAKGEACV